MRTQVMNAVLELFDLVPFDPDPIFSDGFESDDTSAWLATVGGVQPGFIRPGYRLDRARGAASIRSRCCLCTQHDRGS